MKPPLLDQYGDVALPIPYGLYMHLEERFGKRCKVEDVGCILYIRKDEIDFLLFDFVTKNGDPIGLWLWNGKEGHTKDGASIKGNINHYCDIYNPRKFSLDFFNQIVEEFLFFDQAIAR